MELPATHNPRYAPRQLQNSVNSTYNVEEAKKALCSCLSDADGQPSDTAGCHLALLSGWFEIANLEICQHRRNKKKR
jgi:hypothetical protein